MYDYKGIRFDDANTEEEAKALYPEMLEALEEAGFDLEKAMSQEPFMYVPGENDDVWGEEEEGPRFCDEFKKMKKFIRENRIADYDTFAGYCREQQPEWAKLLEKQDNADTARGYIRFLQKPRNQKTLYGEQLR